MPKQPKTTGKQRAFPVLDPVTLNALHRYVERHGAAKTCKAIDTSESNLYRILKPGEGVRQDTLDKVRSVVLEGRPVVRESGNGSSPVVMGHNSIKLTVEIELNVYEAARLLAACTGHGVSAIAYIGAVVREKLRAEE